MHYLKHLISMVLYFLLMLFNQAAGAVSSIQISIGNLEQGELQARNVSANLNLLKAPQALAMSAEIKPSKSLDWAKLSLQCTQFSQLAHDGLHLTCDKNSITHPLLKTTFSFDVTANSLAVKPSFDGVINFTDMSFSDAAGLHAGEKIKSELNFSAAQLASNWRWKLGLNWQQGEVFWQPFYMSSNGHHVEANGQYDGKLLMVEQGDLTLKSLAHAKFNGEFVLPEASIKQLHASVSDINLESAYSVLLKPLLEKSMLNNMELAGNAHLDFSLVNGEPKSFKLSVSDADFSDKNGRFALYKVNANLPWSYDEPTQFSLSYLGGSLLKIPLGAAQFDAKVNRYSLTAPALKIPVLDSALLLRDVSTAWVNNQWHWHLSADIAPISMAEFSRAVGWPLMEGEIAAKIPMVTYSNGQLSTEGDIQLRVFDGNVTIAQLGMQTPLGIAPKLNANLQFRRIDLGKLTRTFSFGAIEGKLDGDVKDLALVNWKPVSFDAVFKSSPGSYPKKISQRAVENISALGGAGAAAAVQRSLLRFFEQFNYAGLGLSCHLKNNQCEMGGLESTTQGYVIVKGSGIPAITVLGYNRSVSWSELLGRIKRITQGNAPVIK